MKTAASRVNGAVKPTTTTTPTSKPQRPWRIIQRRTPAHLKGTMPHEDDPALKGWLKERFGRLTPEGKAYFTQEGKKMVASCGLTMEERAHHQLQYTMLKRWPKIQKESPTQKLYRSISMVADASRKRQRRCLGFLRGKLVQVRDGKVKPITLPASVKWFAHLEKWWDSSSSDGDAMQKWLGMIARAVAA